MNSTLKVDHFVSIPQRSGHYQIKMGRILKRGVTGTEGSEKGKVM